jgi:ornithine cyclodeaminase
MPIRLLTGTDVTRLLPMQACIDVMTDVLTALARGEAIQPLRTMIRLPGGRGVFGVMPAQVNHPDVFGLKVITVFPGNEGSRYDSHQGAVLLFEPEHGTLAAIMDASAMTAIRTAAVSAVATRLLARPDAGDLALLGTGVQARTHLEAMRAVRTIRRVRAWSRDESHRRDFAEWAGQRFGLEIETPGTARETVEGADLICTVTASRTPVLEGAWIASGAHINAVGAALPDARELDTAAVVRARLFVDRRESALNEAGDVLIPRAEGAISDEHLQGELGDILTGRVTGREDGAQVTLFKSLGLAVEDVAAAQVVYREGERRNVGTVVELGGLRDQTN